MRGAGIPCRAIGHRISAGSALFAAGGVHTDGESGIAQGKPGLPVKMLDSIMVIIFARPILPHSCKSRSDFNQLGRTAPGFDSLTGGLFAGRIARFG